MYKIFCLLLALAPVLMGDTGTGGAIFASGSTSVLSAGTDTISQTINPAFAGNAVNVSSKVGTYPNSATRYAAASQTLQMDFGTFHYQAFATAVCPEVGCGTESAGGNIQANTVDTLQFNVASGILALDLKFDGSDNIASGDVTNNVSVYYSVGNSTDYLDIGLFAQTDGQTPTLTTTAGISSTVSYTLLGGKISSNGQVFFPFSGGGMNLFTGVTTSISCNDHLAGGCVGGADFLNTGEIGGAQVLDANGNVIPGATITSASGYNYAAPLGANVPEPSSAGFALGAAGLASLWLFRRRA